MNKYEVAKEITLAAISNKSINTRAVDNKSSFKDENKEIAENIATFYNTLVQNLEERRLK